MNTLTLNNISLDGGNVIIKKGDNNSGGSGGGTAPVSKGDVTFYDYDGTILHSYTKNEFLALSAMPKLPERQGLICQEWNWSFEDAIAYVRDYGILDVGATYITDDGKTRFYISILSKVVSEITLTFSLTTPNSLVIDWGDGKKDSISGTGDNMNAVHKYEEVGDYVIAFEVVEGAVVQFKQSIFGISSLYSNMLKKVEIGNGVTSIGKNAFDLCPSLSSIVIPQGVTSVGNQAFGRCYSLSFIVIPQGITSTGIQIFHKCYSLSSVVMPQSMKSIGGSAFVYCYSLSSVVIPQGMTIIDAGVFSECSSLSSLVIPKRVSVISASAFSNCSSLVILDFSKSTSVPMLATSSAIPSQSGLRITVPDDLYSTWIAETNWSSHASRIVKASEFNA